MMKSLHLLATMFLTGCISMQPIDGSPVELQNRILAGELLAPGDHVWIVTADEKAHRFRVASIDAVRIAGAHDSVRIDQIRYLEKRQIAKLRFPVSFSPSFELAELLASLIAMSAYAAEHQFQFL
jgi:hypothetical protein